MKGAGSLYPWLTRESCETTDEPTRSKALDW
jgi:hypothetical protein